MPIVPSRSREIHELVQALEAPRGSAREAAAARLGLLGRRAVSALVEVLSSGSETARQAALAVLDASDDPRASGALAGALKDRTTPVAVKAAEYLGRRLVPESARALRWALSHEALEVRRAGALALAALLANGVVEALEPLVELLLDSDADERARVVALGAVAALPSAERDPLLSRLGRPGGELGRRVAEWRHEPSPEARRLAAARAELETAAPGSRGASQLHGTLKRVATLRPSADAWALRLRLHHELAKRDSRVALYDLREMLQTRPLGDAGELLALVGSLADASLLPALAGVARDAPALTGACLEALRSIAGREKLSGRHPAVRATPRELRPILHALLKKLPRRG